MPETDTDVPTALSKRLLEGSPIAEVAHVALAALTVDFLYDIVPVPALAGWGVAVVVAAVGRALWRRRARRSGLDAPRVRRALRAWVALSGAVWGLGAGWVAARTPFEPVALVLIVLAGLIAGGLVTLMADRPAFRILLGTVLVPLIVGILLGGTDHDRLSAVILIVVFGGFEAVVHERAHRDLLAHESTKAELQESLSRVKLLSGLLPICAGCKKIRDDEGNWQPVETYVHERSEAEFTHGLCPDCIRLYMGSS